MAYNLRLTVEYKDINGIDTQINAYKDGYAGEAEKADPTDKPLRFDWGDRSTKQPAVIYGSSAVAEFDADVNYQFIDLFSSNARKTILEVKKDGAVFWKGFVAPEKWNEPLIAPPYPVSLKAYDGLGLLKNESFTDGSGEAYTGMKTAFEIVRICLEKTGLQFNINTNVNIREATQTTADDSLLQTEYDCSLYRELSCYDILKQFLNGCRVQQRGGEWYVIANNLFINETIPVRKYNYQGAFMQNDTFNTRLSGHWIEGEPGLDVMPAMKKYEIAQDFGYKSNLLNNGNFKKFNEGTGDAENWTAVGVTPEIRTINEDGDKYIYLPGQTGLTEPQAVPKYVYSEIDVNETSSFLKLKLKYALLGKEGRKAHVFILVTGYANGQTHYLRQFGESEPANAVYYWGAAPEERMRILMNWHYTTKNASHIDADRVIAYPVDKVTDHFQDFSLSVAGLPFTGKLRITLCIAQTDDDTVHGGACFTALNVSFLDANQDNYQTNKIINIVNNPANNFKPEKLELLHGDLPALPNRLYMYRGGIVVAANGQASAGFKVDGVGGVYKYAELIGRLMASELRKPRQSYSVQLADCIPGLAMVFTDPNNPGRLFLESGITYTDHMQTIEGRYVEIFPLDLTASDVGLVTIEETTGYEQTNRETVNVPSNFEVMCLGGRRDWGRRLADYFIPGRESIPRHTNERGYTIN